MNSIAQAVIAIPARDEAERIEACIAACLDQPGVPTPTIVVLANNCRDDTADRARAMGDGQVHVTEIGLPPPQASAGWARRMAMDAAARRAGPDGVLLCTDADARPEPGWLAANLRAIRQGADAVAGVAEIDPEEARLIPTRLHQDDARECTFAAILDELDSLIDPDPADPWPRHDQHSGASIAVRAAVYHRAGGIPPVSLGEDRAFFTSLRRIDARIRHAPDARVIVSGRTIGRAPGGMADTMRRRLAGPDPLIDIRLEPADRLARRAACRRAARQAWRSGTLSPMLARRLKLPVAFLADALTADTFGLAWEAIEVESPTLRRAAIRVDDLARHTSHAARLLERLRIKDAARHPADTRLGVPAA